MYGSYALFGMMFGAFIFGTLADKLGRKKIILICVSIFSLFMILSGLAPTPELFGVFRFITGLGLGGMMPNVIGLISEYSPKGTRSRMIADDYGWIFNRWSYCCFSKYVYDFKIWLGVCILFWRTSIIIYCLS